MLGLNVNGEAKLKAWARVFARTGALCTALAMTVWLTGCSGPTACNGDPCDDGNACTEDDCETDDSEEGFACTNILMECEGDEVCVDGECTDLCADNDCDDGLYCNGTETCDAATGDCVDGDAPCDDATEDCDEDAGVCVGRCDGVECPDNGNGCTDEACDPATGECETTNNTVDCNDGDDCTVGDACAAGACVPGAPMDCPVGEVCEAGVCIDECNDDTDCDDGDFCNGAETCDGGCVDGTDPCTADEFCNEETDHCDDCVEDTDCADTQTCVDGACVDQCTVAADCADVNCSTKACSDDGVCVYTDVNCDNDLFCDGVGTCDADTGECVDGDDPCDPDTHTCNEADDACELIIPCTEDIDCDNGFFCDGVETCDLADPDNGVCVDGASPCNSDETCDEDNDICVAPAGQTLRLTPGMDTGADFTAGSGDDTFDGNQAIVGGVQFDTLNVNDMLDGGDGTDTLIATITGDVSPASLDNIEVFQITHTGARTLGLANAPDVTSITAVGGTTGALIVNAIQNAVANFGVTNTAQNVTFTLATAALSGTGDTATLTMNSVQAGCTINIGPATGNNGYETLNVVSAGSIANAPTALNLNNDTFATLNISGAQDINFGTTLDNTVTTIDASAATGKVTALLTAAPSAMSYTGGSGKDTFTVTAAQTYTFTGGAGDDKFVFTTDGAYDNNKADTIDGGDGTDTLGLVSADAALTTVQTNVSGIETLEISDAMAASVDVSKFGAITTLELDGGHNTGSSTATLPDLATVKFASTTEIATNGANLTLTTAASGLANEVTVKFNGAANIADLIVANFEILNLDNSTAASTFENITLDIAAGTQKVVITGNANITLGSGFVFTCDEINASAFTGILDMGDTATVSGGAAITGGTKADVLIGSTSPDSIVGGPGDDILSGGIDGNQSNGIDSLTGDAGSDDFVIRDTTTLAQMITSRYTITDFVNGTDNIDYNGATDNVTQLDGTVAWGATGSVTVVSASGNLTMDGTTKVYLITVENATAPFTTDGADVLGALVTGAGAGTITTDGTAGDCALFVISDGTNTAIYLGAPGSIDTGIVQAELALVATLENHTMSGLTFGDFK